MGNPQWVSWIHNPHLPAVDVAFGNVASGGDGSGVQYCGASFYCKTMSTKTRDNRDVSGYVGYVRWDCTLSAVIVAQQGTNPFELWLVQGSEQALLD